MKEFYVICDNIRSLDNIGSIFRTCDALGVTKIYLCGITSKPPVGEDLSKFLQRKIAKTALGAEKTVAFEYCKNTGTLINKLKNAKINIIALEQAKNSVLHTKFKPKFPLALIIGNELKGISKSILKKSDKIIELPMAGKKESLNVSVAFAVVGYQINSFRK